MNKLSTPCYYSECEKEATNDVEKKRSTIKSRIPLKMSSKPKISTSSKLITNISQAKEPDNITKYAVQKMDVLEVKSPDATRPIEIKQSGETPANLIQVEETDAKVENEIEQFKEKPENVLKVEESDAKLPNMIKRLPKKPTFVIKSFKHIQEETKMKAVLTAQDIFRLRVPQPRNFIERVCTECNFFHVSEPRYRKPIVVLDLDTLRLIYPAIVPDRKPTVLNLLESVYKTFDIAIWSSLKMDALISKLEMLELFRIKNKFKVSFVLDKTSLTSTVHTEYPMLKDIEVIWNLCPQYCEHNSIIVNNYLKDLIYAIYKVPVKKSKTIQLVDEVALSVVMEYLADIFGSQQSLIELNTPLMEKISY